MTNYQKLREQINKILYPCGDCGGQQRHEVWENDEFIGIKDCKSCNGTGIGLKDWNKLGKPPTLQDVLRVILNKRPLFQIVGSFSNEMLTENALNRYVDIRYWHNDTVTEDNERLITLDLSKQPSEWSDEVWGELLELIK